jgi:hypothetical protein
LKKQTGDCMFNKLYLSIIGLILFCISGLAFYLTTFSEGKQTNSSSSNAENKSKETAPLVEHQGTVEQLFFHPLIADPKKAFRGDFQSKEMDKWFVTIPEFNRIIESLYKRNYILVNIQDVYEEVEKNGEKVMQHKKLMVPKGKKPIVISIDDLNYYQENHIDYGTVHKLVLDNNGDIATLTIDDQGKKIISKDNEIVPILDEFVKKYPDFSLNGAKGTINLTGYEGILGYRTNTMMYNEATKQFDLVNPKAKQEIEAVKPIIKRLKETGWNFASHSYHHRDHSKITMEKLIEDSEKWEREVKSLIGPTNVYVYPYGAAIPHDDERIEQLYKLGFRIFLPVGSETYEEFQGKMVSIDRRRADGLAFRKQPHLSEGLFDSKEVFDKQNRPKDPGY